MRTTLELPDELFQRLKFRASATRRPLRQIIEEALERGLGSTAPQGEAQRAGRPLLPVIVPATGKTMCALTNEQLHAIELHEELKRL